MDISRKNNCLPIIIFGGMSGNYEGNLIDCESGFVHRNDQQLISNLSPIEHPLSQRQRGAAVEHVAPSPFRGLAPLSVVEIDCWLVVDLNLMDRVERKQYTFQDDKLQPQKQVKQDL